uniref:Uncharacterized protein n=1 Tax=Candidatus Kentrum sp. SD TaxID=2126332 RepID=A0A451BMS9_9GAMM|nr:MAG: hypothetical protein BECKSD772F_GA0070984_102411 [Candidatus Kentron sp. SD]VFK43517.1 MAG: hypothetical protein BECKSD772E_GA0070983_102625 [Candidatus Kentron sp. SD]VFK79580.1 MAG: hypothetical protein BECKSD772D_GA0070982_105514 [Candidatus Kentron sp. SD]
MIFIIIAAPRHHACIQSVSLGVAADRNQKSGIPAMISSFFAAREPFCLGDGANAPDFSFRSKWPVT